MLAHFYYVKILVRLLSLFLRAASFSRGLYLIIGGYVEVDGRLKSRTECLSHALGHGARLSIELEYV